MCVRRTRPYTSCKNEEHAQQLNGCWHSREVYTTRGMRICCGGTQRNPMAVLQFQQLHHYRAQSSQTGRERGSGWSNGREIRSWWLRRLSTAMDSAPGLHWEICGHSCHHQGLYSGECVSCSNPEYPGEKIHLRGWVQTRVLLCFSSPERWVHNGWRKWRWTCFKFRGFDSESYNSFGWLFLKDNRKMQVIAVFAKWTVQWSRWDFTHLQKQGPRAEL